MSTEILSDGDPQPERARRGLRIGLAQIAVNNGDKAGNLARAGAAVAEAAGQGADMVVLPEMMLTGFPLEEMRALAEPRGGPGAEAFRRMAVENGVAVVAGYPELDETTGAVHNMTVVFSRRGAPLLHYAKTHLFDSERMAITPGATLDAMFTFEGVRFGALCCFDIELPETARTLALKGAQCIVVPTGNMEPWGHHHRVFIMARALENHVFVAYANQYGEGCGVRCPGESALVDPLGRLVCDAGAGEKVLCGDMDLGLIEESRLVFDYLRERRPELYA